MTIERFCHRLGIPRSTYYYWRGAHLAGREVRRWPAPVVDEIARRLRNRRTSSPHGDTARSGQCFVPMA